MIHLALANIKALTSYYIEHVCSPEARQVILAHECIHRGRTDTVCYLTAAALVWLISGRDMAAPFSGVWEEEQDGSGIHRVIAFSSGGGDFFEDTLEHVLIVFADEFVIDSHFMRKERAAVRPMSRLHEFAGLESRTIRFDAAPHMDLRIQLDRSET